jgi:hypothetical protein
MVKAGEAAATLGVLSQATRMRVVVREPQAAGTVTA